MYIYIYIYIYAYMHIYIIYLSKYLHVCLMVEEHCVFDSRLGAKSGPHGHGLAFWENYMRMLNIQSKKNTLCQ